MPRRNCSCKLAFKEVCTWHLHNRPVVQLFKWAQKALQLPQKVFMFLSAVLKQLRKLYMFQVTLFLFGFYLF